jgi:hypothetical protein
MENGLTTGGHEDEREKEKKKKKKKKHRGSSVRRPQVEPRYPTRQRPIDMGEPTPQAQR